MIITRTPLRISLLGGGTDVSSFYENHAGVVVSFAINKYIYVNVNKRFEDTCRISYSVTENVVSVKDISHDLIRTTLERFGIKNGVEIATIADIPGNGTGLGSSSALTVGLIKALSVDISNKTLAERAYEIESGKCGHPVGKQDMYASAFGGMNLFTFTKNNVDVQPLCLENEYVDYVLSHFLLLWTGITRDAKNILLDQKRNFKNGGTVEIGKQLSRMAFDFGAELLNSTMEIKRIGEYIGESWKLKRFLSDAIATSRIDELYATGIRAGAFGGKLLGAGGGGFLLFVAPPQTHGKIVEKTGLRKINFKLEPSGSEIVYGK